MRLVFKHFVLFLFMSFILKVSFGQQVPTEEGKILDFDYGTLSTALLTNSQAPSIELPLYDGGNDRVNLKFTKITDGIQPANVLTFGGVTAVNKYPVKLTITHSGMSGVYKAKSGYIFFESLDKTNEKLHFYTISDVSEVGEAVCGILDEKGVDLRNFKTNSEAPFPVGSTLRTYRMAAAAAAEMYVELGSKELVRDKIVAIINAANLIFELETAISFQLISETTTTMTIIFDDVNTDPYDNPETFASAVKSQNAFNDMATSGLLAKSKYDVGHTFNIVQAACQICGQAGPTPCSDASKARGMTQFIEAAPVGAIAGLYVHEVGHQFGASHTYNAMGGSASSPTFCTGGWSGSGAVEPGSGTTLMAYGDNCSSPTNYVISGNNQDEYFHTKSLEQIFNSLSGTGGTCITNSVTGNIPPISNAGSDFVIPKGTPFELTGTATDANTALGNLTYTWEQFDAATANDQGALGSDIAGVGGYTAVNSTTAPIFRSKLPSANTNRTFPDISYILNNANNPNDNVGEDLSQVARDINFRFTVRDNENGGGGVDSDGMVVTVADSGPFSLSMGNGPTLWFVGDTKTISWDVNSTDQAPVSCSNVNILISYDGGVNFASLIANTPNDGTESIIVPNNVSAEVRIKIEAVGNIFFDINDVNITITDGACMSATSTFSPDESVSELEDSEALNLSLTPIGDAIPSFSGILENTDSPSHLSYKDTDGSCADASNANKVDIYTFYVSQAGNYEFTFTGAFGLVMNLYRTEYDFSDVCSNWLDSSLEKNPADNQVYFTPDIDVTLAVGTYQIVMSSFHSSFPALPTSYTINVTQGTVYELLPAVGSPYDYSYLAYDTSSGLINSFDANAGFQSLSTGTYKVYGLSFGGGVDLSSYEGFAFSTLQSDIANDSFCGKLSTNSKDLEVTGCPGVPSPPNVADITIEYGETGTLTAAGCSGTVNWFDSEIGGVSLASGNSFTSPALTVSTTYYASCTEDCESETRGSGIITVNANAYCDASGLDCSDNDVITNVTLSFLSSELFNQDSECGTDGFTLYDMSSVNLTPGQSYNLSLTKNVTYFEGLGVWIDFNGNGVFEETEHIWSKSQDKVAIQSTDFTVPANAQVGHMRMRIRIQFDTEVTETCSSETNGIYGEVEDYILNIAAPLNPCEVNASLTSPDNDFSEGVTSIQVSDRITGNNHISGGNVTYGAGKSVVLEPGFIVNGAPEDTGVFLAEIDGCE